MAIKKFYSTKAKAGWRWDRKENKFWSYGFDIYLQSGKRKRESGFATRQLAESAVARIKLSEKEKTYHLQTREFPLLSEVFEKRLLRIEDKKERVRAETNFNSFLSLIPARLRFDEIETRHFRLFLDKRLSEVKAASANRELNRIASAIHSAYVDYPELENFPTPKIPRPKLEKSRRERLITQAEVVKLLTELFATKRDDESAERFSNRQTVGQVFQMCLLTGSRIGEITALRWEQIDFDAKILQIAGTKTRYSTTKNIRYIELTPTIEQILRTRRSVNLSDEFVFSRNGNSITDYYEILREAAEKAGIPYGAKKRGGFVTHDARHTAITRMLQAGVDLSTVGSITGHSDANLILHYSHATRESRKQAVEVLENFVTGEEKANAKKAS